MLSWQQILCAVTNGFLPAQQADRTALVTIAELNQNFTTNKTTFNWELVFEAQVGKPFPVKLEMVAYNLTSTPANGKTILTLAENNAGLTLSSNQTAGSEFDTGGKRKECTPCEPSCQCGSYHLLLD